MVINPDLQEMTSDDLRRRYEETFVRYDDRIVLVKGFGGPIRGQTITFISWEGFQESKFNAKLLDISRPAPRWILLENKLPRYIYYSFERQFHRGFSRDNIVIRDDRGRVVGIPAFNDALNLFDEFYRAPLKRQRISFEEAKNTKETLILSPQILLTQSSGEPCVFFREKYIGVLGNVLPEFEQELIEVIGDYVNERPAREVEAALRGVAERKNNRKNAPRVHANVARNREEQFDDLLFQFAEFGDPIGEAP